MPTKGTTKHSIRIDDALWQAARAKAEANGTNLSLVIRRYLERYTRDVRTPK